MPATFGWYESNTAGETPSGPVTSCNWKSADTSTGGTDYQSNPITAGDVSYEKWQYGQFSGSWSLIQGGLFGHTAGDISGGTLTLWTVVTMTADGDRLAYSTPQNGSVHGSLTNNITAIKAIDASPTCVVYFGTTLPAASGKGPSVSGPATAYTNYLTTQLDTTGGATVGDTATVTLTLRYDES